ncbi:MAG: pentapeptide repeat-containing protein [Neisseriaceae bacterium]
MKNTIFTNVDLTGANLAWVTFGNTKFNDGDLTETIWIDTDFRKISFNNVKLNSILVHEVSIRGTNFSTVEFTPDQTINIYKDIYFLKLCYNMKTIKICEEGEQTDRKGFDIL